LKCLRAWRDDPRAVVADDRTVEQEIGGLLEWFICQCISYGPPNLRRWWSDGVIHLEITQTSRNKFKLLGVTWIDGSGIAPFEIDVVMDPRRDDYFSKCQFRIGMLDRNGQPIVSDRVYSAREVLDKRPRNNRDWAMAVELTPSSE
jgi:hypothetical protein